MSDSRIERASVESGTAAGPSSTEGGGIRLRDDWPVIAYLATLIVAACILAVANADQATLCLADEKWAACVRNWVNAAGNVLAVAAASFAAYFAFGQFKATRKQAEIARLPSIEDRIRSENLIDWLASEYLVAGSAIISYVDHIIGAFESIGENPAKLYVSFSVIKQAM